eukprot:TRINITY_DN11476_c0_g1_i5.p1 TRINITY_DN11476_c0_g1~~TRINITY_DN11476_c0_g1_i5.p1  ORF type:complete len:274 (-),score=43.69 TRINITY_DN11476_c0_g1_i5:49-870(-)
MNLNKNKQIHKNKQKKTQEQQQTYQQYNYKKQQNQTQFKPKFIAQVVTESNREEEKCNQSPVLDPSIEKNAKSLNFSRDLNYKTQQQFKVKKFSETQINTKLQEIYQTAQNLDEEGVSSLFTNSEPNQFLEQFFNTFYDTVDKQLEYRLKIIQLLLEKQALKVSDLFTELNKFLQIAPGLYVDFIKLPIWSAQLCFNSFLENNLNQYIKLQFDEVTEEGGLEWDCIDGNVDFYQKFIKELKKRLKLEGTIYYCLLYTSPSPRDRQKSRMPSSA